MIKKMAFTGATPWHGLGATLTDPTNIDQCLKEAGLDWDVRLEPVKLAASGEAVTCGNAVVRTDTGRALSLVGNGFVPLKNADAFEWFRPWVESGEATIETAGELIGGNRVWVLAKVKGTDFEVGDGDRVNPYILLAHGHGGTYTMAIRAGMTAVRVVCNNTLSMALGGGVGKGSNLVKIAHTKGAATSLESVREAVDYVRAQSGKVADVFRTLTQVQVTDEAVDAFLDAVYGKTKAGKNGKPGREPKKEEIRRLFEEGTGADLSSARGTAWGLYNALTEYESHHARSERTAGNVAGRLNSLAFGGAGVAINKAMDAMRILAEARSGGGIAIEDVFGSDMVERAQDASWAAA
jgi:phage/plasmid-like protein (TIGR03299 family)